MNMSEKMIHRQNQPVDPMFTFFTVRQKWKAYISQSSTLGGEETGQEKNKEKKSDDEEREIISCPHGFIPKKLAFKTS